MNSLQSTPSLFFALPFYRTNYLLNLNTLKMVTETLHEGEYQQTLPAVVSYIALRVCALVIITSRIREVEVSIKRVQNYNRGFHNWRRGYPKRAHLQLQLKLQSFQNNYIG